MINIFEKTLSVADLAVMLVTSAILHGVVYWITHREGVSDNEI